MFTFSPVSSEELLAQIDDPRLKFYNLPPRKPNHPDDEALGCAGPILKHAASGDRLFGMIMTEAFEPQWSSQLIVDKAAEVECVAKAYGGVMKIRHFGKIFPGKQLSLSSFGQWYYLNILQILKRSNGRIKNGIKAESLRMPLFSSAQVCAKCL